MNCCLFDVQNVLSGRFEMGNLWYNEPKTLDTTFDVVEISSDLRSLLRGQRYGGLRV